MVPLFTLNLRLIECCRRFELKQLVCYDTSLKTKMSDKGLSIVGAVVPYIWLHRLKRDCLVRSRLSIRLGTL